MVSEIVRIWIWNISLCWLRERIFDQIRGWHSLPEDSCWRGD